MFYHLWFINLYFHMWKISDYVVLFLVKCSFMEIKVYNFDIVGK